MALATRCPYCQTAFRVASDQLKLRAGLVRCGTCKEIFNGIENLLHPDEDINAAVNAPVGTTVGRWPAASATKSSPVNAALTAGSITSPVAGTVPAPTTSAAAPASSLARRDSRTRTEKSDNTLFQELIAEVDHPPPPAPEPVAPVTPVKSGYAASYAPVQMTSLLRTPSNIIPGIGAVRADPVSARSPDMVPPGTVSTATAAASVDQADQVKSPSTANDHLDSTGSTASAEPFDAQVSASLWQAAASDFDENAPYSPGGRDPLRPSAESRPAFASAPGIEADTINREAGHEGIREAEDDRHDGKDKANASTQASISPLPGLLRPSRIDESHAAPLPEELAKGTRPAGPDTAAATRILLTKPFADDHDNHNGNHQDDSKADAEADDLPDFVAQDLRRQGLQRIVRPLLYLVAVLLALLLLGQLGYAFRTSIAANFPQTRPLLDEACRLSGCSVGLPMQIDSVSIESSDFQPLADKRDQFMLNVLLRNRGVTVQAWPSIELTLNDATDKIVARRVIAPRDYLPAGTLPAKGFAAGSEQPIRLVFELVRLTASGYRVYLFYP